LAESRSPRVTFVYPNPRRELAAEVAAGRAPDTTLLGQIDDRALAASLGSAARRAVEERFTTRHFVERIAPVLRAAA